jgi:hypothetical protein
MKIITLFLLTVFLGKSCDNVAQNDIKKATIQYTANTRGFYQRIVIINQKATVSRDRDEKETPIKVTISDSDWKELVGYYQKINLEELPKLKDPTQNQIEYMEKLGYKYIPASNDGELFGTYYYNGYFKK